MHRRRPTAVDTLKERKYVVHSQGGVRVGRPRRATAPKNQGAWDFIRPGVVVQVFPGRVSAVRTAPSCGEVGFPCLYLALVGPGVGT